MAGGREGWGPPNKKRNGEPSWGSDPDRMPEKQPEQPAPEKEEKPPEDEPPKKIDKSEESE